MNKIFQKLYYLVFHTYYKMDGLNNLFMQNYLLNQQKDFKFTFKNICSMLFIMAGPEIIKQLTNSFNKQTIIELFKNFIKLVYEKILKKTIYEKRIYRYLGDCERLNYDNLCLAIDYYLYINNIHGNSSIVVDNNSHGCYKNKYYNNIINIKNITLYINVPIQNIKKSFESEIKKTHLNITEEYILTSTSEKAISDFLIEVFLLYEKHLSDINKKLFYLSATYSPTKEEKEKEKELNDEKELNKNIPIKCNGKFIFKKFPLINNKTLETLFIPNKNTIIKQLEMFKNKTGKYIYPNISHKLGILLYGCPGSGKTSFVKCLSNYYNRSIISIPLSQIKTNEQFFNLLMNPSINVDDHLETFSLNQVIYLIEDLDAISSVITKRSSDKSSELQIYEDQLNLSTILNVLDGVIDTPQRIIIFTTNHIEHLDPALLRPGRIDLQIELSYLKPDIAEEMIKYYFSDFENNDFLRKLFSEHQISPATLEQIIRISDDVQTFQKNLEVFKELNY